MSESTPFQARVDRLVDRLNPIIVKEIRQGLRTRIFWVAFGLMLLACFVISLVAYGTSLDGGFDRAGAGFFFGYFLCLSVVHFFVIPYSAYRSLAREREDETWILLSLTGIGAKKIIRGKVGSYLAQALLYGSAVLPFLLFSYYLNGIDLPTILTVVALGVAYMVFLTCVAACAATLAESRLVRGLVHFVVLGALLSSAGTGLTIAGGITFDGNSLFRDPDFKVAVAASLWAMITYGYLMYQAAAARLALPTEDYARGPRLALLLQTLGSTAIGLYVWNAEGRDHEIALVMALVLLANLFVVGMFMRDGASAVHEVHYRRGGWSLLRPGSVPALRFLILLVGATVALWTTVYSLSPNLRPDAERGMFLLLAGGAFVLLYLSAPVVIAKLSGLWVLTTSTGVRIITIVLVVAGSGMPPLIALLLGMKPDNPALNLLNPTVGLVNFIDNPSGGEAVVGFPGLVVVLCVSLGVTLLADRLLSSGERQARERRSQPAAARVQGQAA